MFTAFKLLLSFTQALYKGYKVPWDISSIFWKILWFWFLDSVGWNNLIGNCVCVDVCEQSASKSTYARKHTQYEDVQTQQNLRW